MAEKKRMKLSSLIHQFFLNYLPHIKGVSPNTINGYRHAFTLFLPFAAKHYKIKVKSLRLEHLSSDLILAFLQDLQMQRGNLPRTRNHRLAALKSFAKMIRLMYPDQRQLADAILNIPQKRSQRPLIGFLHPDEILAIFHGVDLRKKDGFRDFTLLHLLYDSGARATEIATLNIDYFNPQQKNLAILGKGNRFRLVQLEPKTSQLLKLYIRKYRQGPKPLFQHRLFINQRREGLTRYGVYRICNKYISKALPPKRLKYLHPVHSFRHTCAVNMLYQGKPITDIKNHLGHSNVQSTMLYLQLDLNRKRSIQKELIAYMQSVLSEDPKIEELLQWEGNKDLLQWLDSL
jgi:integrase/recombinase XerD